MSPEEDIKRLKVAKYKCLDSTLFFTRYFFKNREGRKFLVNDHHAIICDALDKVFRGEIKRLIINVAPRYSKTELAVKNFIAKGLAHNPSAKFIHLTYAANLALDNSEATKDLVQSDEFQQLFDVQIKKDSKAKEKWYTSTGGGVYAAAAGGQVTGFGAGRVDNPDEKEADGLDLEEFMTGIEQASGFGGAIIIDDPIKPDDAESDTIRDRINLRFESTIRSRVNSRKTPIIVIQQRVHKHDLSGYLMDAEPGIWEVIKLPCLKSDGTALWPIKHTVQELNAIKAVNSYVFDAQYQQEPTELQRGGEHYAKFDFTRCTVLNVKGKNNLPELYNPDAPLHLTWDFNTNPFVTCCLWQLTTDNSIVNEKQCATHRVIKIDEICLPWPKNRTEDVCKEFIYRYRGHGSGIFIYGDPAGRHEDTRSEAGHNDYSIITRNLADFKPQLRILNAAPSVVMRGNFMNKLFEGEFMGINLKIGQNCLKSIDEYQNLKQASDGTKAKIRIKDPVTKVSFEKYGHISDADEYFICWAFSREYLKYQQPGGSSTPQVGKATSRNSY